MRPVDVDFLEPSPPARWMWIAVGILGCAAAGVVAVAIDRQMDFRRLQAEVAVLRTPLRPPRIESPRLPVPYEASANAMLREASSEWPHMLVALEAAQVAGVRISSVDVLPTEGQVRVEVHYDDMRKLLTYLDELNTGETRRRWILEQARGGGASSAQSTATLSVQLSR